MAKKPPTAARTWVGPDQLAPLLVPLAELSHDPRNARAHDERSIAEVRASLEAYGQVKPIVADTTGKVIAGNGTLAAATMAGWTHLAVVRFTGTPEQAAAYAIADNRTAELSTWDSEMLTETLALLQSAESAEPLALGFSDVELRGILGDSAVPTNAATMSTTPRASMGAPSSAGVTNTAGAPPTAPTRAPKVAPEQFPAFDEDVENGVPHHRCPACNHRWPADG